jgi:hypothetical protein
MNTNRDPHWHCILKHSTAKMCFIEIKQWQQSCLVKLGYKPMSYMDRGFGGQVVSALAFHLWGRRFKSQWELSQCDSNPVLMWKEWKSTLCRKSWEGLNPPFLGTEFINNVNNVRDVKIIFQIFNCKSIYNDYTYNYSYRKFHFHCLLSLF